MRRYRIRKNSSGYQAQVSKFFGLFGYEDLGMVCRTLEEVVQWLDEFTKTDEATYYQYPPVNPDDESHYP